MKTLLIVDGNSIINRAYYGIRPLTTKEGIYTNAVYGMITILQKQLDIIKPDYCAMAFDLHEPTFRHKAYDAYKAGRHATPDELRMQFPYAKEVARAMGFAVLSQPGYEADDILGTLSREANAAGCHAYCLTGDRDSLQLIDVGTTVLLATNKETVTFDRERFIAEYGVAPEQFVDVKALMGDSSDNIPGVAGVGEKTALKLISEYGSLDALYDGLSEKDIPKGTKAKLEAGKESAYFSKMLATIVRDAPLDVPFSSLSEKTECEDRHALRDLFVKLEFSALIRRMGLESLDEAPRAESAACENESGAVYTVEAPTEITAEGLCALACDEPAAIAVEGERLYVKTVNAPLLCNDTPASWKPYLEDTDRTFYVHDAKALYHTLDALGIACAEVAFDTMLAGYMLSPTESDYALQRLSVQYLGRAVSCENAQVAVALTFELASVLAARLAEAGMENLYHAVELPLSVVLFKMEKRGFLVDVEGLCAYGEQLGALCEEYESRIFMAAGKTFNVNSPKQLAEVLFDTLQLPCPGKKRSTNAEVLDKLRPYHPIIDDILEYRQVAKLKSTYTDGLVKVADEGGRIHSCFHQTVTATGRLSSTEPNLQNIPIRTEQGRVLRKYFIAKDKDHVLVDADYSQIELRLLAAISGDETMIEAFKNGVDIHSVTASEVFGVPISAVTSEMRKRAKAVNFGIVYGIGDYSLSVDIGVTKRQAADYIASYKRTYPAVAAYLHDVVEQARRLGYVTTIYGRRRAIPELSSSKKMLAAFGERVAMNSPIQGSAADIIKAAMVSLEARLSRSGLDARLILQVHDELIVECHREVADEVKEIVREEMENVIDLAVPLTVDVKAGDTWYDGH